MLLLKTGCRDYHDVVEVMQETCIVAWNKFDELDDPVVRIWQVAM